ncbi:g4946 [Coccomyxa elongata]
MSVYFRDVRFMQARANGGVPEGNNNVDKLKQQPPSAMLVPAAAISAAVDPATTTGLPATGGAATGLGVASAFRLTTSLP